MVTHTSTKNFGVQSFQALDLNHENFLLSVQMDKTASDELHHAFYRSRQTGQFFEEQLLVMPGVPGNAYKKLFIEVSSSSF